MTPERPVLVAPDSFKGTFRAAEVAGAIGRGIERAGLMPPDLCPLADGGEGTMEALLLALGGDTVAAEVHDPLGAAGARGVRPGRGRRHRGARDGRRLRPRSRGRGRARPVGGIDVRHRRADLRSRRRRRAGGAARRRRLGHDRRRRRRDRRDRGARRARRRADRGARRAHAFERAPAVFGPQKGADAEMVGRLEERLAGSPPGFRATRAAYR